MDLEGYTRLRAPGTAFAAQEPLPGSARNKKSDAYPGVVAVLNPKLRVIRGRCGLQWIAQRQNNKRERRADLVKLWFLYSFSLS
jgi:hypothetical protein